MTVLKTSGNEVVADFNENGEPTFVKVAPRYQFIEVDKKNLESATTIILKTMVLILINTKLKS